jgi:tetratricopeptide (TPR) repeat protein
MNSFKRFFQHLLPVCAVSLGLGSFSGTARADASSTEAQVEARRSEAKRRFELGVEQYRAGRYEGAVTAFLEADRLAPSPALSFNIARAYERLADTSGALRWYRDYLRRSPRAKNAAEVRARIAVLSAQLGQRGVQQLSIFSTPDGATVLVDGRAIGVTPFTGELPPGKHVVLLDRDGYRDARSELVLSAGTPGELNVLLEPEPNEPARRGAAKRFDRAPADTSDRGERRFGPVPWIVAGAGVAGLGGALGFELMRRSDEKAAQGAGSQLQYKEHLDGMQRQQTRARVLVGVGGGLLVTGGVMLLFNDRPQSATRVAIGCNARGCTAGANGSF